MTARARRTALIAASVPEETKRTFSIDGTRRDDALGELHLGAAGRAVGGARGGAPCGSPRATAFGMCPKRCGPYDMT